MGPRPLPYIKGDLSGALSAAIITIPMSIGYGMLAFAPLGPQFAPQAVILGLNAGVFAGFFASLCGGTAVQITGPQAPLTLVVAALVTSLLANPDVPADPVVIASLASLSVLAAGVFQLIFSVLGLSGLVKYIPQPVVSGFMNGISVLVIIKQIGPLLGAHFQTPLRALMHNPGLAHVPAGAAGVITIVSIFIAKRYIKSIPPLLMALLTGTLFYSFLTSFMTPSSQAQVVGELQIRFPPSMLLTHVFETLRAVPFRPCLPEVVIAGLMISILASMESMMSSLVCDHLSSTSHDSKRELLGQGLGNVISSIFGSLPAAGSVARSSANYKAGGRTRASGMMSSVFILCGVVFCGSLLGKVPTSVVAGIIMVVGFRLFDTWTLRVGKQVLTRTNREKEQAFDLLICLVVTLLTIFLNLIIAVFIGILIASAIFIKKTGKSVIKRITDGNRVHSRRVRNVEEMQILEEQGHQIGVVVFQGPIFFGSAESIYQKMKSSMAEYEYIILDFKLVTDIDATGSKIIQEMTEWLKKMEKKVFLSHIKTNKNLWHFIETFGVSRYFENEILVDDIDVALECAENSILSSNTVLRSSDQEFHLSTVSLFQGFSSWERDEVKKRFKKVSYSDQEVVFQENDSDRDLFILVKGLMSIHVFLPESERSKRLVTYGPGTVVGEMSFLDGSPRSATVRASEDAEAFCLTHEHFQALAEENPELATKLSLNIAKEISQRLRRTSDQLGQLEDSP